MVWSVAVNVWSVARYKTAVGFTTTLGFFLHFFFTMDSVSCAELGPVSRKARSLVELSLRLKAGSLLLSVIQPIRTLSTA